MRALRHAAADNSADQLNKSFLSKDCTPCRELCNTKSMCWMGTFLQQAVEGAAALQP